MAKSKRENGGGHPAMKSQSRLIFWHLQISKNGRGFGLKLPASLMMQAGIRHRDVLEVWIDNGLVIMQGIPRPKADPLAIVKVRSAVGEIMPAKKNHLQIGGER